ncbi:MarR family winged helix-turn-helix transcriptional regulator [Paenibacillus sp. NPDC058174]|uniref:MarR family winged helix-turn-helix transcriptional regulator n=1 Tax=Paenibacillus sp. NPDC058174 TaxID=3346366 RepID=UPI0036D9FF57
MDTLELLLKKPDLIAVDIAGEVGLTRGAVSYLLDKLEEQGLITRQPHPTSRRSFQILVTEKGQTSTDSILKAYYADIEGLFTEYSAEELSKLRQLINKLLL